MILTLFIITLFINGILSVEEFVCESKNLHIECPANSYIFIDNATYGRHNSTICPKISIIEDLNCTSNATQILREKCGGKNNCSVPVINQIFGDPCAGTYKYLDFNYTCHSEPIIGKPIGPFPPIISPPRCGTNEERVSCGPLCNSRYCKSTVILPATIISPGIIKPPPCFSCCICKQGYLKDHKTGICVKEQYCPIPGSQCQTNEVFSECDAGCQRTCFNRKPNCKDSPCVPGYVCAENFVRDPVTNRCVYPFHCRNRRIIN